MDNITSKKGKSKLDVEVTRSLTGTGLRTEDSDQIILEPVIGAECPVELSKCTNGFTLSVFLKADGTLAQFEDSRFLLGNAVNEQKNGFFVGISERELKILVRPMITSVRASTCQPLQICGSFWDLVGKILIHQMVAL